MSLVLDLVRQYENVRKTGRTVSVFAICSAATVFVNSKYGIGLSPEDILGLVGFEVGAAEFAWRKWFQPKAVEILADIPAPIIAVIEKEALPAADIIAKKIDDAAAEKNGK